MKIDSIDIESKSDGIYLVIDLRENDDLICEDVVRYIKEYGVEDFDPLRVSRCVRNAAKGEKTIVKISSQILALQEEETVEIEFSEDYIEAYIVFHKGYDKNKQLTFERVLNEVMNAGILYGLDTMAIHNAFNQKKYDEKILIAKGKKPIDGQNGYVTYLFDTGEKKPIPEILENGKVDFHKLNLFEMAEKDQILAQLHAPTEGIKGMDVFAQEIPYRPGKPAHLPKGENIYITENEKSLCAAMAGQIVFKNNRISITEVLVIQGDVDHSTGDIQCLGSVCIHGSIRTKFLVEAEGNIEVHGVVEGGHIKSSGNVLLHGGLQGQNISTIYAAGNVSSRYVMNSVVYAGGNMSAGYVLHSQVFCGGFLEVNSSSATLVGGNVVVNKSVVASIIGSQLATPTVLEVGVHPDKLKRYKEHLQELNRLQKEMAAYEKAKDDLEKTKTPILMDKLQKAELICITRDLIMVKSKLKEVKTKLNELIPELKNGQGQIIARKIIQPGVKVVIGNAALFIQKEIESAILIKRDNKIQIHSGHF